MKHITLFFIVIFSFSSVSSQPIEKKVKIIIDKIKEKGKKESEDSKTKEPSDKIKGVEYVQD